MIGFIGAILIITSACAPLSLEVFFSSNPSFDQSDNYPKPLQQRQEPVNQPVTPTPSIMVQPTPSPQSENRLASQLSEVLREAEAHVRAGEARIREQKPLEAIREFEHARLLIEQDVDPILQYIDQQSMTESGFSMLSTSRIQQFQGQRVNMLSRINRAYDFRTMYAKQQQVEKVNALRKVSKAVLQPIILHGGTSTSEKSWVHTVPKTERQPIPISPIFNINWLSAEEINYYISRYQQRHVDFRQCLLRANQYFSQVTSTLFAEGVPEDLAYIALIESGYQPSAKSSSGKAGLWQLSPSVAKSYGLNVGTNNDERLHITRSTRAFAQYMSHLHNKFGSWELAIIAYGVGEQTLQNTINRVGLRDPQVIKERIGSYSPEIAFLARVVAGMNIAKNPKAYGFDIELPNISRHMTAQTLSSKPSTSSIITLEPPAVLNY